MNIGPKTFTNNGSLFSKLFSFLPILQCNKELQEKGKSDPE